MDAALINVLIGTGVAGVFCAFFVLGWIFPKSVVDDLRVERDYERKRADANADRAEAAIVAAQGTRDILTALQAGVTLGRRDDVRSVRVSEDSSRELLGRPERDPA